MDYELLQAINGLSGQSNLLDHVMTWMARYVHLVFAAALVGLWLTWRPGQQRGALLAGASAVVSLVMSHIMLHLYPRPRPYKTHPIHLMINPLHDTSFPSHHATFCFAITVVVWQFNRKVGVLLLALSLAMMFSRTYVGAHYPTDLVGGALLGSAVGLFLGSQFLRGKSRPVLDRLMDNLARWRIAASSETEARPRTDG